MRLALAAQGAGDGADLLDNIGFISLALRYGEKPYDAVGAVEFLSTKIGLVVVVLGVMHFFNMNMLVKFRFSKLFRMFGPKWADSLDNAFPAQAKTAAPGAGS